MKIITLIVGLVFFLSGTAPLSFSKSLELITQPQRDQANPASGAKPLAFPPETNLHETCKPK